LIGSIDSVLKRAVVDNDGGAFYFTERDDDRRGKSNTAGRPLKS